MFNKNMIRHAFLAVNDNGVAFSRSFEYEQDHVHAVVGEYGSPDEFRRYDGPYVYFTKQDNGKIIDRHIVEAIGFLKPLKEIEKEAIKIYNTIKFYKKELDTHIKLNFAKGEDGYIYCTDVDDTEGNLDLSDIVVEKFDPLTTTSPFVFDYQQVILSQTRLRHHVNLNLELLRKTNMPRTFAVNITEHPCPFPSISAKVEFQRVNTYEEAKGAPTTSSLLVDERVDPKELALISMGIVPTRQVFCEIFNDNEKIAQLYWSYGFTLLVRAHDAKKFAVMSLCSTYVTMIYQKQSDGEIIDVRHFDYLPAVRVSFDSNNSYKIIDALNSVIVVSIP
jgi:hypothetical protein